MDKIAERQEIDHRWGQLHSLEQEYASLSLKFLFLANAGGAIATLSFVGTSSAAAGSSLVKWTLVAFVVGVALYGLSVSILYFRVLYIFEKFKADAESCLKGDKTLIQINDADSERSIVSWLDYILPLMSFLCFIVGCGLGGAALFP